MDEVHVREFIEASNNLVTKLENGKEDMPTASQRKYIIAAIAQVMNWLVRTQ